MPGARQFPEIGALPVARVSLPGHFDEQLRMSVAPHTKFYYEGVEEPLSAFTVGRNAGDYARRYPQDAGAYGALPVLSEPRNIDRPVVNFDTSRMSGAGYGTPTYLAAWDALRRLDARNVAHHLSVENQARRSTNMGAYGQRGGNMDVPILSPQQRIIKIGEPRPGEDWWMTPQEFHRLPREVQLGLLAEAESRNVRTDIVGHNRLTGGGLRMLEPDLPIDEYRTLAQQLRTVPGQGDRSRLSTTGESSIRRAALLDALMEDPTYTPSEPFTRKLFKKRGGLASLR
jgi:hypothetical protein